MSKHSTATRDDKIPAGLTPRRRAVLQALMHTDTHPTAREIRQMVGPHICLATVYHALDYLTQAGLVNEHHLSSGGPARYCVNFTPHFHLVDEASGRMLDVQLKPGIRPEDVFELPEGARISSIKAYLHGQVPPSLSIS